MDTVGQRIEAIAATKGLPSGAALAKQIGITYETLRKWRSGATAPNRNRLKKVLEVLGVEPIQLLFAKPGTGVSNPLESHSDQEDRLLLAFRTLPARERSEYLQQIEDKAEFVNELISRLRGKS